MIINHLTQKMSKPLTYLIIGLFINLNASAAYITQTADTLINDGPYIYFADNGFSAKWIENDIFRERKLSPDNFIEIKNKFRLVFNYNDLKSSLHPCLNRNINNATPMWIA